MGLGNAPLLGDYNTLSKHIRYYFYHEIKKTLHIPFAFVL